MQPAVEDNLDSSRNAIDLAASLTAQRPKLAPTVAPKAAELAAHARRRR